MVTVRLSRAIPAKICIITRCVFNSSNSFGISSLGEGMLSTECHSSLKFWRVGCLASNTPFYFGGDRDHDQNSSFLPSFMSCKCSLCTYSIASPDNMPVYLLDYCELHLYAYFMIARVSWENHKKSKARRHLANQIKMHDCLKRIDADIYIAFS